VFAFFLYGYFPIVFLLYPETTCRTLEDMDVIFQTNPSPFVLRNKTLTQRERPLMFIEVEQERIRLAAETMKQDGETLVESKNSAQDHVKRVV
jgi:hypothetical protein